MEDSDGAFGHGGPGVEPEPVTQGVVRDEDAYHTGYARTMREVQMGRAMGWRPTERQLVVALTRTARIYAAARRGRFVGGQRPDALKGRTDALRALLRQGVGSLPEDD